MLDAGLQPKKRNDFVEGSCDRAPAWSLPHFSVDRLMTFLLAGWKPADLIGSNTEWIDRKVKEGLLVNLVGRISFGAPHIFKDKSEGKLGALVFRVLTTHGIPSMTTLCFSFASTSVIAARETNIKWLSSTLALKNTLACSLINGSKCLDCLAYTFLPAE